MVSGIYLITDTVSNQRYVGSSRNVHKRWSGHRNALRQGIHCNSRLQTVWNEHEEASFKFEILEIAPPDNLQTIEQYYLDWMEPELNIVLTAYATLEESCAQISALQKGKPGTPCSAETRAKISAAKKGKKLSSEHRAKLSIAHKGIPKSAEWRAKISASNKGQTRSAEARARMSEAQKGRTPSAETRAKLSIAGKGRKHSPETRAKISAAQKGRPGKIPSAETRAKMSAAHKIRLKKQEA